MYNLELRKNSNALINNRTVKRFEANGKSPGESEAGVQTRAVPPPQGRSESSALEKQSRHAGGGSLSRLDASCIIAQGYEVGEAHGLPPE